MGADAVFAYFGLRYRVESDAELDAIERGVDDRVRRAKRARLRTSLIRLTEGEPYLLLVGTELAVLGIENAGEAELSEAQLLQLMGDTKAKLAAGGFQGEPALHLQLDAQY